MCGTNIVESVFGLFIPSDLDIPVCRPRVKDITPFIFKIFFHAEFAVKGPCHSSARQMLWEVIVLKGQSPPDNLANQRFTSQTLHYSSCESDKPTAILEVHNLWHKSLRNH